MTDKMRSFLKGLALGLAGKPLEFAPGKEPVAYLYNGVQLPKLPEWDKTAYPYAVIIPGSYLGIVATTTRALVACANPFTVSASGNIITTGGSATMRASYDSESNAWGEFTTDTWGSDNILSAEHLIWADHDIYDADGNLYLAVSEPVAVYE